MIGRAALVVFACVGIRDVQWTGSQIGGLYPVQKTEDEVIAELPFASTEQALIVWDEAAKTEHLVLELRYDKTDASFGILIPVPGTPTVEKVTTAPFDQLRDIYTFTEPGLGLGGGYGTSLGLLPTYGLGGGGWGSGRSPNDVEPPPPPAVEVLDEHPVGSFTSFTLAIHDAGELDAWMKEKGFAAPPSVGAWAERYARMDFAFVALKYTAPDGGTGTTSQALRISFPTPQLFFPYSEPYSPKVAKRLIAAWVVAPNATRPIASHVEKEKRDVARPWRSGMRYTATHDELATIFKELAPIIPAGEKLSVQTFRDWKTSRAGWGDVLFVPQTPAPLDDAAKAEKRRLLGVLDPDLVPPPKPKPVAVASAAIPSASTSASASASPVETKKGCGGCNASGSGSGASPFLLLAFAIVLGRKRALALLGLLGCAKTEPSVAPADVEAVPSASAAASTVDAAPAPASTLSADDEKARVEAAFATLSGDVPEAGLSVLAGTAPIPPPVLPKPRPVSSANVIGLQVQGPIGIDYVRRILAQRRAQLRYCYEKALQLDPNIKGTVAIKMAIAPTGDVMMANAGGGTITNTELQNCIATMLKRVQFPPPDGGSVTTASFQVEMKMQ